MGLLTYLPKNGFEVQLIDISQEAIDRGLSTIKKNLDRMLAKEKIDRGHRGCHHKAHSFMHRSSQRRGPSRSGCGSSHRECGCELKIFQEIDAHAPAAILATNTSSISITRIAAATKRPGRVIGMHFMNPVPIMKLVEIINGYSTEEEVTKAVVDLSTSLGKIPVACNDYPGFVANRILMPMINEAMRSLHEGVGGVEEIDTIMKLGMAHPMGPLQLADFIGLDVCLSILRVLHDGFGNPKYAPSALLVNMVARRRDGREIW